MKEIHNMSDDKNIKNQNENQNEEKEKQGESNSGIALGMCFGVAFGTAFGQLLFHNMALGICFGLAIGVGLGSAYDALKSKNKTDDEKTGNEAADQNASELEQEEKQPESGE